MVSYYYSIKVTICNIFCDAPANTLSGKVKGAWIDEALAVTGDGREGRTENGGASAVG